MVGKCREWTEEQIETAAVLCLVYGKFIEVWRQKEAALQNSQLTKLLLANSAHEVRTPLNAIINYLEIALEGAIDQETRENLSKSHSASKSLIYVINDLLDLTKTEEGHELIKDEVFDLPATVREAANMFAGDAKRKQIGYEVTENPDVPQYVIGDQRRVRQAISNVIANAIQHTSSGVVKIEMWLAQCVERRVEVDIVIEDTGAGMTADKLDALFRDLEQVQSESDEGLQEQLTTKPQAVFDKSQGTKTLGLGLALVARILRNMNGQLRLKSEEGKGSRFVIQFGFDLPDNSKTSGLGVPVIAAGVATLNQPLTPPVDTREVLLVNRSAQKAPSTAKKGVSRRGSNDSIESARSMNSLRSFKSGTSAKSDVDRLIDALQEPHIAVKGDSEISLSRSGSRSERRSRTLTRRLSTLSRSHSMNKVSASSSYQQPHGDLFMFGSKTPVRSSPMPVENSSEFPPRTPARVLFEIPDKTLKPVSFLTTEDLHILVAEDDPINSKIVKKRLEKIGHSVHLTVNGEECSSAYGEKAAFFDVVLMDMQVGCPS